MGMAFPHLTDGGIKRGGSGARAIKKQVTSLQIHSDAVATLTKARQQELNRAFDAAERIDKGPVKRAQK
ncbi:MAG: hypothetical protein V1909_05375 [Candidatus Micrarchaeota archaeon]